MNRGICKVRKYKQTEVRALEASIKSAGKDSLYCEFGGDLIDYDGDSYYLDTAKKRINSLFLDRNVRKDAIYVVDVVVSVNNKEYFEGLKEGEEKQFFHDCFVALSKFFGAGRSGIDSEYLHEDVIAAVVMTNKHPCMHFSFVPVTKEGKLSAKDVVSRKMLFSLQKYLFETVFRGYDLSENIKEENLLLKFDLDQIRTTKDQIRNTNTVETDDQGCLMVELDAFKNGSDQLKRLDAEFKEISIENDSLRDENLELLFEIGDLRDENRELQEKIKKLEMKNNISQFNPKSWTVVQGQELALLRVCFDFLLRKYVGGMASIDSLPDSAGKKKLKELRKHYESRGGKK